MGGSRRPVKFRPEVGRVIGGGMLGYARLAPHVAATLADTVQVLLVTPLVIGRGTVETVAIDIFDVLRRDGGVGALRAPRGGIVRRQGIKHD